MSKRKIILEGKMPPSKKNSKQICFNRTTGKRFIKSSTRYKAWEDEWVMRLNSEKPVITPCSIEVNFYPGTARKFDLSNKLESVQDMFVKAGLLEDDNWKYLPEIQCKFVEIDRENPRLEITIKEINDD